jgi:chromosome segregation ATPase
MPPGKTYPQQIQDLKEELRTKNEAMAQLEDRIALIPELQEEITILRGQVQASTKDDNQTGASHKAQLTDLQQVADSNAELAKRYSQQLTESINYSQQLESQLDLLGKERFKAVDLDKKLELTADALKSSNLQVISLNQRIRDVASERDAVIEQQSRELQSLRLQKHASDKILYEVREALNNAPDVIASLKYIVGINGPSN